MKSLIIALALAVVGLSFSNSLSAKAPLNVLSEKTKLYFDFIVTSPVQGSTAPLHGKFQVSVIRPDGRVFKGPKILANSPITGFEILVPPPVFEEPYVIVVSNLNVIFSNGELFVGSFIDPSLSIRNSSNAKVCSTTLQSIVLMNPPTPVTNRPRRAVEATVMIPRSFIK